MTSTQAGTNLIWAKGRGRGKRPNQPFSPARRPGEKPVPRTVDRPTNGERQVNGTEEPKQEATKTVADVQSVIIKGQKYLAKFTYKANPSSPLGQEVSLTQGEYVTTEEQHKDNDMWCKVTKSTGESGFVPAKYLHRVEEKVTALPWLANKDLDRKEESPPPAVKGPPKPYVSAYTKSETPTVQKTQYRCDICEKDFNGPRPYSAHMVSKAHKLEVELAEEREQDDAAARNS